MMRPKTFSNIDAAESVDLRRCLIRFCCIFLLVVIPAACSQEGPQPSEPDHKPASSDVRPLARQSREPLPAGIHWITNESDPGFADPRARRGGTLHLPLTSFPLTFRVVGPDSNAGFRDAILGNQLDLIGIHPNTLQPIPALATHWAYGGDKKTMYFKLNPKARWSDGVPLTADDFAFTVEFMRSKYIVAPWYNDYYTQEIDRVVIYGDYTLAVVGTKPQPDLYLKLTLGPTPRHFYGRLGEDFIRKYNWAIVPNTGPYQIDKFKKGRFVRFARKQNWWAADLKYFKYRYNVDRVIYKVIRDTDLQWEYFKKGKLDVYSATSPKYWHIKSKTEVVAKGYVHKIWFANDTPQPALGLYLNEDRAIFKEPNQRYAFAHAMNVEKVISDVLHNDYFRLESGYVGYGRYSNTKIKARRYNIQKVQAYMQAAGWVRGPDGIWTKNGQRFSVEVVYYVDDHTPRLVVLKEEARKAGIELRLLKLDPAAAFKKILEKRHDVSWSGWSTSLRPHFWEHWHSVNAHKGQTNNITNTDDPELDQMIDTYRNSLKEDERIALSLKIQEKVAEVGSYVPSYMVPYFREVYWRWWRFPTPPATRTSVSLFSPFDSSTGGLFWYDSDRYAETRAAMDNGQTFEPLEIIDKTYKP